MAEEHYTPWIKARLAKAARNWDNKPEWSKPVVNSPYFAARADQRPKTSQEPAKK